MDEVNKISDGAKFIRADLHIHSFGAESGSFDVKDDQMTPANIVETAIKSGLSVISITDHNEIGNVQKAIEYAQDKEILVVPGIEVSTVQGHILLYFETFENLRSFYGKLNITEDKQRCNQGIVDCLDLANQYNGFGILAHIELDSGFEKVIGRFSGVIEDCFCHPSLLALEISKKDSFINYTDLDQNAHRKKLISLRRKRLNQPENFILPKVMSSDSHYLDKLGKNADGANKLTRFKVDECSFHAIRIALLSYESRVRIEDMIPERIPYFVSVKIKGGLLDGQIIKFSKNLTCIIGGRGTGKSTLLESLREVSGNKSDARVVDSDVWPNEISLVFEDETGRKTEFKRSKNDTAYNSTNPSDGISCIKIESYGQGETAETIQHSDDNPQPLLKFLDSFIDTHSLIQEDNEICELLLENQSVLGKLRIEVGSISDTKKQIANLKEKKDRLEKDKVGDLVKYQASLIGERTLRDNLVSELNNLITNYKEVFKDKELFENIANMSEEDIIVGKAEFAKVKKIVEDFSEIVDLKSSELNTSLEAKISSIKVQLKSWKEKETDIQKTIDEKKEELEEQNIPFDIGKINQILNDLDHYNKRLIKLNQDKKALKNKERDRAELIKRRKAIKQSIYNERFKFARNVNENLKNSVDGLHVLAKFEQGCYSPQFEESIKQLMEWRTSQVKKAELIASKISPLDFCEKAKNKDFSFLAEIVDSEGKRYFSDSDIDYILDRSSSEYAYEDFETLKFEDRPILKVTKVIKEHGKTKNITRSIAQLSLGQQQSILLAILIQSRNDIPLLIDQPEDNLDSEFIYKTIVDNLKKIKETRQVIIVTHNANIAVLGDAELVIPLKSTSLKTSILDRGSIDRLSIRNDCCAILEGGERAFVNRQKIYNISN